MNASPQFASYREQPILPPPPGPLPAPIGLRDQPIEQPMPHVHSAPVEPTQRMEASWQEPFLDLRFPREFGTEAIQWLRTNWQAPMLVLTIPEEFAIEGRAALAAMREHFQFLRHGMSPEQVPESRYIQQERSYQVLREDLVLKELKQLYLFEDPSALGAFIGRNRFRELLIEARDPLNAAFGETAVRKLRLVEDDEGYVTLFCLVLVPGELEEARRALNSFDEAWWLARSHEANGKLNFDFELI